MYPYCDTHKYVIYLYKVALFLQEETVKEISKSADKHVCLCVMSEVIYYMYIYIIYNIYAHTMGHKNVNFPLAVSI